jgi:hypothetical protein
MSETVAGGLINSALRCSFLREKHLIATLAPTATYFAQG